VLRRRSRVDSTGHRPSEPRPDAPRDARNLIVVVLDSLRYDSCVEAGMNTLASLGTIERRWSYASWTAPSHHNLLMGLLPHLSPAHLFASELYKSEYQRYGERLNVSDIEFRAFLPHLWLPTFLRDQLGYRTHAMVSMPVLNPATPLNHGFDSYELMPTHNDMSAMVDRLDFDTRRPTFALLNVGETHYPYALPDEDPSEWPRVSGVHGVLKRLDEKGGDPDRFFSEQQLIALRDRQIRAARYIDSVLAALFDRVPARTWVVVTSDHGELFGEAGYFGHGPINHEKVLEVPFVEGMVP
jgi:Sulfatase